MSEVCIIGGGASGLMAALTALSDPRNRVTLLERQGRVGRKLLSTGNGRCNLSNRHASPVHYHGADPDFCRPALEAFPVAETLRFFHQLGLVTVEEPDGKLYPRSNTANSVLDVLRLALEGQPDRLTLRTGDPVTSLKCRGQGFTVTLESGEVLRGMDCVILAAGGAAGSKVGGVLDGYRLAKGLGHHRTALTPALVQAQDRSHLSPLPEGREKHRPHYSAAGPGGAGGEPRRNSLHRVRRSAAPPSSRSPAMPLVRT